MYPFISRAGSSSVNARALSYFVLFFASFFLLAVAWLVYINARIYYYTVGPSAAPRRHTNKYIYTHTAHRPPCIEIRFGVCFAIEPTSGVAHILLLLLSVRSPHCRVNWHARHSADGQDSTNATGLN